MTSYEWGLWIKSPGYHKRFTVDPPLSGVELASGACFVTGKNSIWDCIYVWDFCSAILTDLIHLTTQINQAGMLACNLFYIIFWGSSPFHPHFFFFLEVGVLFNLKINCSLSVTELAIHLGWLHLQFTFRNPKIRMHFTLNFLIDCICTYFSKKLELLHLSLP